MSAIWVSFYLMRKWHPKILWEHKKQYCGLANFKTKWICPLIFFQRNWTTHFIGHCRFICTFYSSQYFIAMSPIDEAFLFYFISYQKKFIFTLVGWNTFHQYTPQYTKYVYILYSNIISNVKDDVNLLTVQKYLLQQNIFVCLKLGVLWSN